VPTIATLVQGFDRDVLAYVRIRDEVSRALEDAYRTRQQVAQALAETAKMPLSIAKAIEDAFRSAREIASVNRMMSESLRPVLPPRAERFPAWNLPATPATHEKPSLPFGFHPQH